MNTAKHHYKIILYILATKKFTAF